MILKDCWASWGHCWPQGNYESLHIIFIGVEGAGPSEESTASPGKVRGPRTDGGWQLVTGSV